MGGGGPSCWAAAALHRRTLHRRVRSRRRRSTAIGGGGGRSGGGAAAGSFARCPLPDRVQGLFAAVEGTQTLRPHNIEWHVTPAVRTAGKQAAALVMRAAQWGEGGSWAWMGQPDNAHRRSAWVVPILFAEH
jgi:hypothetical protein